MGADQVAAIRPAILEVYNAPPTEDWCATFEIAETGYWVQVARGTLNTCYRDTIAPLKRFGFLAAMLPDLTLADWEPEKYATFSHRSCSPRNLAEAVDSLFHVLLGDDSADYGVDVTLQQL